jgi:hypothetical protein
LASRRDNGNIVLAHELLHGHDDGAGLLIVSSKDAINHALHKLAPEYATLINRKVFTMSNITDNIRLQVFTCDIESALVAIKQAWQQGNYLQHSQATAFVLGSLSIHSLEVASEYATFVQRYIAAHGIDGLEGIYLSLLDQILGQLEGIAFHRHYFNSAIKERPSFESSSVSQPTSPLEKQISQELSKVRSQNVEDLLQPHEDLQTSTLLTSEARLDSIHLVTLQREVDLTTATTAELSGPDCGIQIFSLGTASNRYLCFNYAMRNFVLEGALKAFQTEEYLNSQSGKSIQVHSPYLHRVLGNLAAYEWTKLSTTGQNDQLFVDPYSLFINQSVFCLTLGNLYISESYPSVKARHAEAQAIISAGGLSTNICIGAQLKGSGSTPLDSWGITSLESRRVLEYLLASEEPISPLLPFLGNIYESLITQPMITEQLKLCLYQRLTNIVYPIFTEMQRLVIPEELWITNDFAPSDSDGLQSYSGTLVQIIQSRDPVHEPI